ncbi:MAG: 4Fe-4S dicluster domain-containing protein [Pseudomonadota bacterium]
MTGYNLPYDECAGDGLRTVLEKLFETGAVSAAIVPLESRGKTRLDLCLVGARGALEKARPIAPFFFGNRALGVSRLTRLGELPERAIAILRPCEARSLVELRKLKQAASDNLIILCVDCAGTVSAADYREKMASGSGFHQQLAHAFRQGQDLEGAREACSICRYPALDNEIDIHAGLFGQEGCVLLLPVSEKGAGLLGGLGMQEAGQPELDARKEALKKIREHRKARQGEWLAALPFASGGAKALAAHFDSCEQCRACSETCPVCYCKQCYFKMASMETEPANVFLKAAHLEKVPLPSSPLFFHLGRMTHMAHSCTGCGACTEACPSGIDVAKAFIAAAGEVQKTFDYEPGRSTDDKLPVTIFKEDELEDEVR